MMAGNWSKSQENLTMALMHYLEERDKGSILKAGEHADAGFFQLVTAVAKAVARKDEPEDLHKAWSKFWDDHTEAFFESSTSEQVLTVALTVTGFATGKAIADSLIGLKGKSKTAARMRADHENFLAHLFSRYLSNEAKNDELDVFLSMFSFQASAAASVALPTSALDHAVKGYVSKARWLGQKGFEYLARKGSQKLNEKDFKNASGGKVDGLSWAVYLSAPPRKAHSAVDNCRLALRASLGMPHDQAHALTDHDPAFHKSLIGALDNLVATDPDGTSKEDLKKLEEVKKWAAARASATDGGPQKRDLMKDDHLVELFTAMWGGDQRLKALNEIFAKEKDKRKALKEAASLFDGMDKMDADSVKKNFDAVQHFNANNRLNHLAKVFDEMGVSGWLTAHPYELH